VEELSLENPFEPKSTEAVSVEESPKMLYDKMLARGEELLKKPLRGGGESRVRVQHSKGRMTVWERIKVLTSAEPHITFQNWGSELDGAGIVTGILDIDGRDVAVYGHDFTVPDFDGGRTWNSIDRYERFGRSLCSRRCWRT